VYARLVLLLGAALLLTAAPASAEHDSAGDAFATVIDAPDPVVAGGEITYTITVGNNGPGPATDVELEDAVPAGTKAVAVVLSDPDTDCDVVGPSKTVFKCDLGTIPEGEVVVLVLVVDTSPATTSPVSNVVTIEAEGDSVAANNTATATTTVEPQPGTPPPPPAADLVLKKSDSPDPVAAGGKLTYTLTVTNAGPDPATGVTLVDDIPASTKLVSAAPSQGVCSGSGVISCALGGLLKGGAATVIIVVEPTKPGFVVNSASVSAGSGPFDPITANNSALTATIVTAAIPSAPSPSPVAPPPVQPPPVLIAAPPDVPPTQPAETPAPPTTILVAPTFVPDIIPPGKVETVRATVGNRLVAVHWSAPSDPDFQRVELTRSYAGERRVLYSGRGEQFVDRGVRNGVRYLYELRSFDRAGNASVGVQFAATPKALLLFSPLPNARVSTAPLLRWAAVRGAGFYNVQLYRGSRKVLTLWPGSNRLKLRARWTFRGRAERLAPGTYHWFVWPARGLRSLPRYGPLLGRSSFVVVRSSP
jgi:uncharacterized repeat protein (TIGR01451 family)